MDLLKSKRARLIATQTIVVAGLCVALYFLLLKPDSSTPLSGAGVPGGPRASAGGHGGHHRHHPGSHSQHGHRRSRASQPAGGGAGALGSGTALAAAGPAPAAAWPSGEASTPETGSSGNGSSLEPGDVQYTSTLSSIEAKLALSAKGP